MRALLLLLLIATAVHGQAPSVLLITVDDMSCDSVGAFGGRAAGATPNIDRLARAGLRIEHAHVTVAICQPTRAVWMTGRYPHRNGALGFEPIDPGVPTLVAALRDAGYRTGLMAKTGHVIPSRADEFDTIVTARELRNGREPELYRRHAAAFFAESAAAGRPFFLMANAQDPHRPFIGSRQEERARARDATSRSPHYGGGFPEATIAYAPEQVPVPGFLPDLPEVRSELAEYFASVRRADRTVGALLGALDDSGQAGRTIVVFLSDHGMPLPFAKTNCYRASTRTPWIVRWPGVVAPGSVDRAHLVAGIDLAPTILDAAGLPPLPDADGRSLLPLLRGETQEGRDRVFTQIDVLSSRRAYPMRAVEDARYGYIWNGWADGSREFRNASMGGRAFPAMRERAGSDPALAARVGHLLRRAPEELYDYALDPDALHDLAGDSAHRERLRAMRAALLEHMVATGDPQLEGFRAFLAAADAAAPAAPPAGLICCGAEEVYTLDLAGPRGPDGAPPRRWSWRAADSPEIPAAARPWFRTTDECKPLGPYLLITSSAGGVALVRRADRACVFLAFARNAHSACLLPGGRIAVAASTGGDEVLVFDRSDEPGGEATPVARLPLAGAHGVHWDAGRRRLWAVGDDELLLLRVRRPDGAVTLAADRRWPLPSPGGHDLAPAGDGSVLWVTTNERVHRFDAYAFGFSDDPVLGGEPLVKSVDRHGPAVVYHQATPEHWWSDTIRFADGVPPIRLPAARLYKVRWDVPAPLPDGH